MGFGGPEPWSMVAVLTKSKAGEVCSRGMVERALSLSCVSDNDANVAAWKVWQEQEEG